MGSRVSGLLALVLLAGSLAGCLGDGTDPSSADPAADQQTPGVAGATLSLDGCRQWHTSYASPAEAFEAYLPGGFSVATADPAGSTVSVQVYVSWCQGATLDGQALPSDKMVGRFDNLLPVVPPEELAEDGWTWDWISLDAGTNVDALVEAYRAWGLDEALILDGELGYSATAETPTSLAERITFNTDDQAFEIASTVTRDPGEFQAERSRLWVTEEGQATGYIVVDVTASENVGLGSSTFTYEGPGEAPPMHQGASHTVAGATERLSFTPLAR